MSSEMSVLQKLVGAALTPAAFRAALTTARGSYTHWDTEGHRHAARWL